MTLTGKLMTGFLSVAAITLVVGVSGYRGLSQAIDLEKETIKTAITSRQGINYASAARASFKTQVQEWKNILLRGKDPAAFTKHLEGFTAEETKAHEALEKLIVLLPELGLQAAPAEKSLEAHTQLGKAYRDALKNWNATVPDPASLVDKAVKGIDRAPTEAIEAMVKEINDRAATLEGEQEAKATKQARTAQLISLAGIVGGVLVSIVLGIILSLAVTGHIRAVCDRLFGGAAQVSAAAEQVSGASITLADGASKQAASLEETSASLEEMSSMTKQNAETAQKGKTLVGQTRQAAEASASDVQLMTVAMEEVRSSSEQITKIIKTIDEIAFQTNILALNAAVEAARAGDAGAGFAVVADEVRNLAQRSANAAKETASKIEDALKKTQQGVQISAKVAQGLHAITAKVREVDQVISEIAAGSSEQSQGIIQINQAVSQMDSVTQSNAATAEETASASQELTTQAAALQAELSQLIGTKGTEAQRKASEPKHAPVARKSIHSTQPKAEKQPAEASWHPSPRAEGAEAPVGEVIHSDRSEPALSFKDF